MKVAIGFFDGLHRGHQALLSKAECVVTFRNHPLSVLAPERTPILLSRTDERIAALSENGKRTVLALNFTRETADAPPESFVAFLRAHYEPNMQVFCGPNWHFGRGGCGDANLMRKMGCAVNTIPFADYAGAPISSTRIRAALRAGHLSDARAMLGSDYGVTGVLVAGKGLGRTWGIPTLNLDPQRPLSLAHGAYLVDTAFGYGVANYGLAPSLDEQAWTHPILEVHILNGSPKLALGARTLVTFMRFLRIEQHFNSETALRKAIENDVLLAEKCMRTLH